MTNACVSAARRAVKAGFALRVKHGYGLDRPCDVYELITTKGVTLQFIDVPSLEGMYLEESEVTRVCVCALRPSGRQRLTAAHELGHKVLGHGTRLDAALELRGKVAESSVEERLADTFAHSLLMPPSAVQSGFRSRGYDLTKPTPEQVYIVSGWLGVGFTTLVHHMRLSLKVISHSEHKNLLTTDLRKLKATILGQETTNDVWILDQHWGGADVHMQLGDYVTGLRNESTSEFLESVSSHGGRSVFRVNQVGDCTARLTTLESVRLKVSRKDFVGFYEFRYLKECD